MAGTTHSRYACLPPLLQKTARDTKGWQIRDFLSDGKPVAINFLNAHGVNMAVADPAFRAHLLAGDYLLRDGIGLKMALRACRLGETENLNGTDLIPRIIDQYKTRRIAIFGTSDAALAACRARLEGEGFTAIVSTLNGFMEDEAYLHEYARVNPDIVILCMGMPRQEKLAARLIQAMPEGLVICGGGWADFYAGAKPRAPLWVRRLSAEWIYRLLCEPKRLGRRYTVDIVRFFYALARARAHMEA